MSKDKAQPNDGSAESPPSGEVTPTSRSKKGGNDNMASDRARGSRSGDHYGDDEYAGRGVIKCAICGDPLRDHSMTEVCPALQLRADERLTAPSHRSRRKETP